MEPWTYKVPRKQLTEDQPYDAQDCRRLLQSQHLKSQY